MAALPRVLVAGAGYAGLNAVLRLADLRKEQNGAFEIALVDQHPYHLVKIRLHEAAVRPAEITSPLDELLEDDEVTLYQASITKLDFAGRKVETSIGALPYDYLILALGGGTNFFSIPGLAEHAFALDSFTDAVRLRGHIETQIALAAASTDPADRARRLRFVIGGAGYTGLELAGEMAEIVPDACQRLGVPPEEAEIIVVDAMPRILPVLDEDSAAYATRELEKKGISFRTGVKVAGCSAEGVTLEPGGLVPTATMVWAGGVRANPAIATSGAETGRQGRLVVQTTLQVPGHPEVYAVGDCALVLDPATNQPVPATAQLALQEGAQAAENIVLAIGGKSPAVYAPRSKGEIVSLGRDKAVGWARALGDRQLKLRGLIGGIAKKVSGAEWEFQLWAETHHLDGIFSRSEKQ
jgi:NADH dehydrogenase